MKKSFPFFVFYRNGLITYICCKSYKSSRKIEKMEENSEIVEMTGNVRLKNSVIELFPKKNYHISNTCAAVKISRQTWRRWRKEDPVFNAKISELEEQDIDDSETQMRLLRQGVAKYNKKGEFTGWKVRPHFGALLKHLESKARDRGWGAFVTLSTDSEDLSTMTQEEIAKKALRLARLMEDDSSEEKDI